MFLSSTGAFNGRSRGPPWVRGHISAVMARKDIYSERGRLLINTGRANSIFVNCFFVQVSWWKKEQEKVKSILSANETGNKEGLNCCVRAALIVQLTKAQLRRPQPFWSGFQSRNEFFQAALQSSSELFRWLWNLKFPNLPLLNVEVRK